MRGAYCEGFDEDAYFRKGGDLEYLHAVLGSSGLAGGYAAPAPDFSALGEFLVNYVINPLASFLAETVFPAVKSAVIQCCKALVSAVRLLFSALQKGLLYRAGEAGAVGFSIFSQKKLVPALEMMPMIGNSSAQPRHKLSSLRA